MEFSSHTSGSRHARCSIKGSKDADDRLVSNKILSQIMAHWIGAQGQVNLVKNSKTCPLCDVIKRKNKPKSNDFLKIETRRRAASIDGLNTFLVLSTGELKG